MDGGPVTPKTVLVTGASGGVGRGIALACGAAGWEVWIAARRGPEAAAVADEVSAVGGRGRWIECDVSREASVQAALGEVAATSGGLDGIVHNATSGYSSQADPSPTSRSPSSRTTWPSPRAASTCWPGTAIRCSPPRRGSLVVMTSEAGFEGKRLLAAYAMVKAQQRSLVSVLAREWGPSGVRVNTVAPLASSPAMERAFVADPAMEERVMGRIPLGRLGDAADDIGVAVRFLLGDDARFVTGQTLMVDGGSCPAP